MKVFAEALFFAPLGIHTLSMKLVRCRSSFFMAGTVVSPHAKPALRGASFISPATQEPSGQKRALSAMRAAWFLV